MKRKYLLFIALFCWLALLGFLSACGGGGGGGGGDDSDTTEVVTPPSVSIVGKYTLVEDFTCELLSPWCSDTPNFSGTWSIGSSQTVRERNGWVVSGTWYIDAQVFYIVFDDQSGKMVIPFEFQGNIIRTKSTFFNSTHYSDWLKVSDDPGELTDLGPPKVLYTSPVDGESGVPASKVLTVTFNEAIDPSTISAKSFLLADISGTTIDGTATCNNRTATFTPWSPLLLDEQYTATLTTDIKDIAGNALGEAYQWKFYTSSTATLPAPVNLVAVAGNSSVDLSWDIVETAGYYVVYGATTPGVAKDNYMSLPGGFILHSPDHYVTISGLSNGTTYYFVVTSFRPDLPDHIESDESIEVSAKPHQ